MDAREDGAKRDPAAGAATDGDELAGQQPINLEQQASGVDFVLQGSTVVGAGDLLPQGILEPARGVTGSTSTGLAVGDLRPQDVFGSAGGGPDRHALTTPGTAGGVGELAPPDQFDRPLVDAEHAGGVDPLLPAGRRAAPHGPEQGPPGVVVLRLDFQFQHIAGGAGAGAMRLAALLVMSLAAEALVGGDQDTPWPSQFRALMLWLGGCIVLFLLRH
ncbi:unnamed protein product [Urochloa humidicola]